MDPKKKRSVQTVRNVESAMLPELNAIVKGFLVIRSDEKSPSSAARRIAASPSNRSNARKMKMSEMEIHESKRKNRTTIREPRETVTTTRRRYGSPSPDKRRPSTEKNSAATPAAA